MFKLHLTLLFLVAALGLSACGPSESDLAATQTVGNAILTAAASTAKAELTRLAYVEPSATPEPSQTPVPSPTVKVNPTNIPYPTPQSATVAANTNVRGIPSKSKVDYLGYLLKGQGVQVLARNDEATWLQIVFPESPDGKGWVIIGAIKKNYDLTILPIMVFPDGKDKPGYLIPAPRYTMSGPALPPGTPPPGYPNFGSLINDVFVRIGPGLGYQQLEILKAGQTVTFTGKSDNDEWVRIDYPSGPEGAAWVSTSQVKDMNGYDGLDIYDMMGNLKKKGEQVQILPTATLSAGSTSAPVVTVEGSLSAQLNVRKGPGQTFESMGLMDAGTMVTINGVSVNKEWYRIEFSAAADGAGWVSASYVTVEGEMMGLKVYGNDGIPFP